MRLTQWLWFLALVLHQGSGAQEQEPQDPDHLPPLEYVPGDRVHWRVSLASHHPRGLLCAQLQVYLFQPPLHPARGGGSRRGSRESSQSYGPEREPEWAREEAAPQVQDWWHRVAASHPVRGTPELGLEYHVAFTLRPDHVVGADPGAGGRWRSPGSRAQLALGCLPLREAYQRQQQHPRPPQDTPVVVALSEPFHIFHPPASTHQPRTSPLGPEWRSSVSHHPAPAAGPRASASDRFSIIDITPIHPLAEGTLVCPLSGVRPTRPLRTLDGRHVDREAYLTHLLTLARTHAGNLSSLLCQLPMGLRGVCVDRHLYYQLQQGGERRVIALLQERERARAHLLRQPHLRTVCVFPAPLGLDGVGIQLLEHVARSGLQGRLDLLAARIRAVQTRPAVPTVREVYELFRADLTLPYEEVARILCQVMSLPVTSLCIALACSGSPLAPLLQLVAGILVLYRLTGDPALVHFAFSLVSMLLWMWVRLVVLSREGSLLALHARYEEEVREAVRAFAERVRSLPLPTGAEGEERAVVAESARVPRSSWQP